MKTMRQLGEFPFIAEIEKICRTRSVIKGIGDDAAVIPYSKTQVMLFTADMLIENVHFTRKQPAARIGHKAIACSISDIAAMGGIPRYALVSVAFPKGLNVVFAKTLYQGLLATARRFGVAVVGGDTNCGDRIVIDVFLCGVTERNHYVLRGGARNGDDIFVTGKLGGSLAGRHLKFEPRVKEARFLVTHYPVRAMIDISDGLIADLGHILETSAKAALLREKHIPVSAQAASVDRACYDGEDFELLFTMPKKYTQKLMKEWPFKKTAPLSCIGEIQSGSNGIMLERENGTRRNMPITGYQHFQRGR
ncbi:MAG: thiamine-phosphate kinase [Candidatus Omnitrophica bacterium]|nr:thiamine-phosphate kinase [Candidatus Omnitrophota bacterium]